MELRHLRYFVAVVEEQSFTKAAEKLFIAQPPLSRQIQNLEAELGIQLFERGSRPLLTTEAGLFFYLCRHENHCRQRIYKMCVAPDRRRAYLGIPDAGNQCRAALPGANTRSAC